MEGSVQLDHDYCSNGNSPNSKSNKESSKLSTLEKITKKTVKEDLPRLTQYEKLNHDGWMDSNSRKDSGLESGDVSDASEEQTFITSPSATKLKCLLPENLKQNQLYLKKRDLNQAVESVPLVKKVNPPVSSINRTPEMKIRSALATSILQLRKGVLTKTKSVEGTQKMVSVLKKPPQATQPPLITSNPNESIVTITNSSNNEVQNIIVRNPDVDTQKDDVKKPPRKKLNLAEYRSRREQNRSDSSRTSSPIQPMTLVYIHHASSTTNPIKDDLGNLVWSEREIVSLLKPKIDVEEEKVRPKPPVREMFVQTIETVFSQIPRTVECIKFSLRNENVVQSKQSVENKIIVDNKYSVETKNSAESKRQEPKRSVESQSSLSVIPSLPVNEKKELPAAASSSSPKVKETVIKR